jgi:hypothetical protein
MKIGSSWATPLYAIVIGQLSRTSPLGSFCTCATDSAAACAASRMAAACRR